MRPNRESAQVSVEKTQLPLKSNETLSEFLSEMGKAVLEHLKSKLNMGKNGDVYPVDIYADKCIIDVYLGDDAPIEEGESSVRYYQLDYIRKVDGGFDFGEPVEVSRQIIFVPKGEPVSKNTANIWDGVQL
jgi:hypothetical protein